MKPIRYRLAALFIVTALTIGLSACATLGSAGTVTMLGPWTGETAEKFERGLDDFEADTGIQVVYQGTRALNEDLLSDVQRGAQPDVAFLFSLGELAQYQRHGVLHPIDDVIGPYQDAYAEFWRELQKLGTDQLYAIVVKVNVKSIIWYNPTQFDSPPQPQTWNDLVELGQRIAETEDTPTEDTPWCSGMGSTPTSGWPGTDWLEDIVLHQFGTKTYHDWASGELSWESGKIRQAWVDWGNITADPGRRSALLTDFEDAGIPLFTDPPGCFLYHIPSFAMGGYLGYKDSTGATPQPGTHFDFFSFPDFDPQDGNPKELSADFAAVFNDTPQARQLIRYLARDKGQKIWPKIEGAGSFSAHKDVRRNNYHDPVSQRIADTLSDSRTLCYDAADLMPATMRNAFQRAVLEYLSDPSRLDSILANLEKIRLGIPDEDWLDVACG